MAKFFSDPRRDSERVYIKNTKIRIRTQTEYEYQADLENISPNGIGILSRAGHFEGDKVEMWFELYGESFHLQGEVARAIGKEIYIQFLHLKDEENETIRRFVDEHGTMKRKK